MPVRESPHRSHSHPIMVGIRQPGSCVLRCSCTDLPKVGFGAIDCEPRTLSWIRLIGRLWTQPSCLFGYDFSPDEVIAGP